MRVTFMTSIDWILNIKYSISEQRLLWSICADEYQKWLLPFFCWKTFFNWHPFPSYDKLTDDEKCPNFCTASQLSYYFTKQGEEKTTPSFMSKTCALDRKKISQRSLGYFSFLRLSPRESTCHTAFYDQIVKRTLTLSRSLFSVSLHLLLLVFGFHLSRKEGREQPREFSKLAGAQQSQKLTLSRYVILASFHY